MEDIQSDQSILDELEHLIFDEHKIISYKWVTNHFKIHIQRSKKILSKFNKKFEDRLFVHHLITGFKSLTIQHSNPYNSVYVSPKLRKKSKSRINTNTNSNTNDSYMDDSDDDMTQSQDDGSIDQYQSVYTQKLCEDKKFEAEKSQFNKIVDIHIYCIARDEARNIKDFLNQSYEEDYHQQLKITTAWLSKQAEKYNQNRNSSQRASHKREINELSRFSQISFDQCTTIPSPQLNRALARTKQEIQEREKKLNKNENKDNVKKQIDFDETIENFKKNKDKNRNKTPPINDKLKGLNLNNDDAKSSSSSLSPNANKNKGVKKKKKNDIRGAFAKAQQIKDKEDHDKQSQTQQTQIEEEIEKQKKLTKRKKAGTINNFFNTEAEEKEKAKKAKKSSKKKAAKKATKTKKKGGKGKKKKKEKIGSLKPARKRKRGAMEENNLIPIEYGSESSQDDEDMNNEYDGVDDDDEELEAIKRSFKPNRHKRRKIMVDSDDESDKDQNQDEDDDIDLDENVENKSPKKLTKRQLKQMEHERELKERKDNFFGAAKNNPIRKRKKYKTVAHSYINDKGMFVTEDKKVTDDEDTDNDNNEQKEKERVHKFQHIEYDEDDDIAMRNKENSVDKVNGKGSKKKKNKNTTNSKKKKKKKVTPKKRKNGSITSFFKKK